MEKDVLGDLRDFDAAKIDGREGFAVIQEEYLRGTEIDFPW
jgi:hypothetical protein